MKVPAGGGGTATAPHFTPKTIVGELLFALLGVGAFAAVASTNEKIGKALLYLMLGFFLIFFITHGSGFAAAMQRLNNLGNPKG